MFDILESTLDENKTINALNTLMFKEKYPAESIATSLKLVDNKYDIQRLIDSAARRELPTLYMSHQKTSIQMPRVLHAWKGDFREDTDEIYKIARGEKKDESVEQYQQKMRSKLPSKIPLVRGADNKGYSNNRPLRSWTASVGTARIYGDNIHYTVVNPSDVFMCSIYGGRIGEQEYTLTKCNIKNTYRANTKNHVKLYQKMYDVL